MMEWKIEISREKAERIAYERYHAEPEEVLQAWAVEYIKIMDEGIYKLNSNETVRKALSTIQKIFQATFPEFPIFSTMNLESARWADISYILEEDKNSYILHFYLQTFYDVLMGQNILPMPNENFKGFADKLPHLSLWQRAKIRLSNIAGHMGRITANFEKVKRDCKEAFDGDFS